jgi:trigger factor
MAHEHEHDEELQDQEALGTSEIIADQAIATEGEEGEDKPPRLNLDVKIDTRSACERHITVTVAREDIDRYLNKEYGELMPTAHVPGFRPGHAPRKLVEHRFHKEVSGRVKGSLLMDSLAQIHEDHDLSAISEPELDLESVDVPEAGPMTFEFDLEVRPEFELPQWKGLEIEKPVRDFSAADIDAALKRILTNRGHLEPVDGPAEPGDYITTNLTFKYGD